MALQHFVGHSQELALAAATAVTAEEREARQEQASSGQALRECQNWCQAMQ